MTINVPSTQVIHEEVDLQRLLLFVPQNTDYHANRYDTDDEMVLHLWSGGVSYDIRAPKINHCYCDTHISRSVSGDGQVEIQIKRVNHINCPIHKGGPVEAPAPASVCSMFVKVCRDQMCPVHGTATPHSTGTKAAAPGKETK